MKISTVILDFDDTLYMSEEACFRLENEVLQRIRCEVMGRDIHKKTWGQPLFDAIKVRSPGVDVDSFRGTMDGVHQEFVEHGYIDHLEESRLAVLDRLADMDVELYILTSRTEQEVRHLLHAEHSLSGRIKKIYHSENTTHTKPDPRAFDALLKENNLDVDTCVYVGDSPSDATAAKGAGMTFVASFESGLRTPDDFTNPEPDYSIAHFEQLPDIIALINSSK